MKPPNLILKERVGGTIKSEIGDTMEAVEVRALFEAALKNHADGKLVDAMQQFTTVLTENPRVPAAWDNRGALLQKLGHPFDAIMNYDRAIELDPARSEPYNNRGTAYSENLQFEKALADYKTAIEKNDSFAVPYCNAGNVLTRIGRTEEAVPYYRRSLERDPNYPDAHVGLSLSLLKIGQFEEGWKEFEWRWKNKQMRPRGLPYPDWDGRAAKDENEGLLIYAEQGMGDALQFMRYGPIAKEKWGGKVYLEVSPTLARLARTMRGIDGIIPFGEKVPTSVTTNIAMMTLPGLFGTNLTNIPGKCPYLYADPHRAGLWRQHLQALPPGQFVGICWAGMNRDMDPLASAIDKRRSMELQQFAPLAKVPGISWVSLQLGPTASQIKAPPSQMTIGDFTGEFFDFYDTAAMIECLDLVISVDTSVAHLAGALGKPVWMLSRFDNCWRWLDNREHTDWYPSMRIFGQRKDGDWDSVIQRMVPELQRLTLTQRRQVA